MKKPYVTREFLNQLETIKKYIKDGELPSAFDKKNFIQNMHSLTPLEKQSLIDSMQPLLRPSSSWVYVPARSKLAQWSTLAVTITAIVKYYSSEDTYSTLAYSLIAGVIACFGTFQHTRYQVDNSLKFPSNVRMNFSSRFLSSEKPVKKKKW